MGRGDQGSSWKALLPDLVQESGNEPFGSQSPAPKCRWPGPVSPNG